MSLAPDDGIAPAGALARRLTSDIGLTHEGHKGAQSLIYDQRCVWIAEYDETRYRGIKHVTA